MNPDTAIELAGINIGIWPAASLNQGFLDFLFQSMSVDLDAPDYVALSRRSSTLNIRIPHAFKKMSPSRLPWLPTRNREWLAVPTTANRCWSMDFLSDVLFCGLRILTFNEVDDFNREANVCEGDADFFHLE